MKKPILITCLSALLLSLFAVSIQPALSFYGKVYTHVAISYWYNYDTPFTATHISSCDKFLSEIGRAMFTLLPEPSYSKESLIISESGIERNFTSPQEEKPSESPPPDIRH